MYEELKMLLELLGNLGQYAAWVAVAYIIYKLALTASYVLLAKYLITKVYEWAINLKERPIVNKIQMGDYLMDDVNGNRLFNVLLKLRGDGLRYIHAEDIAWLEKVIADRDK